jgi:hypothetical protein
MYALVESGSITKHLNGNKSITIGDVVHSRRIFTLWTEAERNAIGIYTIIFDDSNKKDRKWYNNTSQSFAFANNKVTATYGSATARAHADANATDADGNDLDPVVVIPGLKTNLIKKIKKLAYDELARTDWYITRKAEKSTAIPSAITTHRNLVRSRQAAAITSITNASDTPALETLYTYTTNDSGVTSRPLAEIPTL